MKEPLAPVLVRPLSSISPWLLAIKVSWSGSIVEIVSGLATVPRVPIATSRIRLPETITGPVPVWLLRIEPLVRKRVSPPLKDSSLRSASEARSTEPPAVISRVSLAVRSRSSLKRITRYLTSGLSGVTTLLSASRNSTVPRSAAARIARSASDSWTLPSTNSRR